MNCFSYLLLLSFFPLVLFSTQACSDQGGARHERTNAIQWLRVVNVAANDRLNLRVEPRGHSTIIATLAYDETNMVKLDNKGDWIKVSSGGLQGWVYGKYVAPDAGHTIANAFGRELSCFGGEPHWSLSTMGEIITYGLYDEEEKFVLNSAIREGLNRNNIWYGILTSKKFNHQKMTMIIEKTRMCTDDMSDIEHPFSITIIDAQKQLTSGCCGK